MKTEKFFLFISVFILSFSIYTNSFAISYPYNPGETLDPSCAPGSTNCTVNTSSSWSSSGEDIYFTGGNVGVGTSSPNSLFSLQQGDLDTGSELITNGDFNTDSSGWELYDSAVYDNGKLSISYTGLEDWADVSTEINLESGKTYILTFDLSNVTNDNVYIYFENNSFNGIENFSNGKNTFIFESDYTGVDTIYIENYNWNINSSWSIDNVSIKETLSSTDNPVFYIKDYTNSNLISLGGTSNLIKIGNEAGYNSTDDSNSTFIGNKAGYATGGSLYSNFIGSWAGQNSQSQYSNFIGQGAGQFTYANYSNFIGSFAGQYTGSIYNSNFFGPWAGDSAESAHNSNFLGYYSGRNSLNAHDSNFFGSNSGYEATGASNSNFIGAYAGYNASSSSHSNFFGSNSGYSATDAPFSNFIGKEAGYQATNATKSNFIGALSGSSATNAQSSNFIGYAAGLMADNAPYSNFLGEYSGYTAANATHSNFLGYKSGQAASSASYSNFFGHSAGISASSADHSNFFGSSAGSNATNALNSNFLGLSSGSDATNASNSNFLGYASGSGATNASYSSFLGYIAGSGATNASNSIFIGRNAGVNDTVNNTGNTDDFSILIGKSTSTGGYSNSIAIGGSATNTATNQFMIGSANRPIDTTRWNGSASTQCTLTTGTGIACTSDERLKTNIEDLDGTILDKIINLKTVTFNWKEGDSSQKNIGFIAQDLEQYFPELVATDNDGYKSVYYANMTPVLTEAIREMNLKVEKVLNFTEDIPLREKIITWLSDSTNGITSIFSKEVHTEKLCIDDLCITKEELSQMLQKNNISSTEESTQGSNEASNNSETTEDGVSVDSVSEMPDISEVAPTVDSTEESTSSQDDTPSTQNTSDDSTGESLPGGSVE